jgi:hypothetical protein
MRLLDLFCGRWGWSRAFAARGWECIGIDLERPPENPKNCAFIQWDILLLTTLRDYKADFIVASSPCQQFSVHGMPHFHPNPKYPAMGIRLFNHTRELCEASGIPYVMENVRPAQWFVGESVNNCGPFHLWGTGVPPLMPQGIKKGMDMGSGAYAKGLRGEELHEYRRQFTDMWAGSKSPQRKAATSRVATIPKELANCIADYAERLLEKVSA